MLLIDEWRKFFNLSQKDLAEQLGVTERTVRYWESGMVHPGRRLEDLAKLFGCQELDLFSPPAQKASG